MTSQQIRDAIRERDGHRCTDCGMTADEHRQRFGRTLDVHRLQPGGEYSLDNGVTLCRSCHLTKPKTPRGARPRDRTKPRIFTLWVPAGMKDKIRHFARRRGFGAMSKYIRNAVVRKLERDEASEETSHIVRHLPP